MGEPAAICAMLRAMKRLCLAAVAALIVVIPAVAQTAAQKPPAAPPTTASVLNRALSGMEREFVDAADAMPADKYAFAPVQGEFKGVRTFGQQARHVAAT